MGDSGNDQTFSENSKPIKKLADEFNISGADAYKFWQDWRNGLLHQAMPGNNHFKTYRMSASYDKALEIVDTELRINPWKFRDKILENISPLRHIWKSSDYPLAKEFECEHDLE